MTNLVQGTVAPGFEPVRDAFLANLTSGADIGASVAIVARGRLVVDLWGGHLDADRTRPWQADTIVNVWSTTKTMTALCALLLVERGELDVHERVAHYWPEFAAAGKGEIEVRHLLSHSSGLSGWQEPLASEDIYDWDKCTRLLAAQAPWWEPGTASGYHAVTQGFLVGEVVRRITGQSLGTFFAKEIAGPLGADFHIGLDPANDARVGALIAGPRAVQAARDPGSIGARTMGNPQLSAEQSNALPWRRAEIPACNGHGNARSVALAQAALACGVGVNGVQLLSDATRDAVFEQQTYGPDLVLGTHLRFGIGYGLRSEHAPIGINPRTCFWGGWGGSLVVLDLDAGVVFSYVMNRMGQGTLGDLRGLSLAQAARSAFEAL